MCHNLISRSNFSAIFKNPHLQIQRLAEGRSNSISALGGCYQRRIGIHWNRCRALPIIVITADRIKEAHHLKPQDVIIRRFRGRPQPWTRNNGWRVLHLFPTWTCSVRTVRTILSKFTGNLRGKGVVRQKALSYYISAICFNHAPTKCFTQSISLLLRGAEFNFWFLFDESRLSFCFCYLILRLLHLRTDILHREELS